MVERLVISTRRVSCFSASMVPPSSLRVAAVTVSSFMAAKCDACPRRTERISVPLVKLSHD
jgi:hypothetical protein